MLVSVDVSNREVHGAHAIPLRIHFDFDLACNHTPGCQCDELAFKVSELPILAAQRLRVGQRHALGQIEVKSRSERRMWLHESRASLGEFHIRHERR